ncbi:gcn5-related n-acetyltransferase [Colletotrichum karsti]|uniref:Gcn5-related n-acetyltransferase n=1 Tax=Colletotrichum karsti TaxID=1095194 RepID=A0A9P6LML9_9PEZI|nr:gcn5-related n-acetyltransferase [Colletotrichum karsti]KAF9878968.1 gcn5-related n-acetyltransferase [Colletotrichum karsti]
MPTAADSDLNCAGTQPVILTRRLLIRLNTTADAAAMARGANNLKIAANMRNTFPSPYLLEHAEGWLALCAKDTGTSFAICQADDGAYIGNIGLTRNNDVQYRTWDVGYWIAEDHWGKGYASEAVQAFQKFCFQSDSSVLRLEASVYSSNVASRKVLEKAGWTYEDMKCRLILLEALWWN